LLVFNFHIHNLKQTFFFALNDISDNDVTHANGVTVCDVKNVTLVDWFAFQQFQVEQVRLYLFLIVHDFHFADAATCLGKIRKLTIYNSSVKMWTKNDKHAATC